MTKSQNEAALEDRRQTSGKIGLASAIGTTAGIAWLMWQALALLNTQSASVTASRWLTPLPPPLLYGLLGALIFYALHGLWRTMSRFRSRVKGNDQRGGLRPKLRHLAVLPAFAFIAFHSHYFLWPLHRGTLTPADGTAHLIHLLSSTAHSIPLAAFGYLLGFAACAVHFCGELIVVVRALAASDSRGRLPRFVAFAVLLGTTCFGASAAGTIGLATGWYPISMSSVKPVPATVCGNEAGAPKPTGSASATPAP